MTVRALLFDFNGVIVDDEPIHEEMLRRVLAEEGITITAEEYVRDYLSFDDRDCFRTAFARHGRTCDDGVLYDLVSRKGRYYDAYVVDHGAMFPGILDLVRAAGATRPLGIVSGALRHEILFHLRRNSLEAAFAEIVSAEDVRRGKPDPEGYALGIRRIAHHVTGPPLAAGEVLVFEDSLGGIQAAIAAGARVCAVANTFPEEELRARG
ncbi:MAG: HAD family phosphatase, partial [Planctomycetes bacterium]|nr:HAD family phosphatase [Planctomycetota bacterium]